MSDLTQFKPLKSIFIVVMIFLISCVPESGTNKKKAKNKSSGHQELAAKNEGISGYSSNPTTNCAPGEYYTNGKCQSLNFNSRANTNPLEQPELPTQPETYDKIKLTRFYSSSLGDHWVTIKEPKDLPSSYRPEASVYIYSPNQKMPSGTKAIYSCLVGSGNHMISTSQSCEGTSLVINSLTNSNKLGYINIAQSAGSIPLYRCRKGNNHFISARNNCEVNIIPESLLGYALSGASLPVVTNQPQPEEPPVPQKPEDPVSPQEPQNPTPPAGCVSLMPETVRSVNANPSGIPIPGAGIHGMAPNTPFTGIYFKPTLKQRTLGKYINTVKSKSIWNTLCADEKGMTLYWEGTKLYGVYRGFLKIFDDLSLHYVEPLGLNKVLITRQNSTIMYYPGCAGLSEIGMHFRACGEYNPAVVIGSEVFSQRVQRLYNIDFDNDPSFKSLKGLEKSSILRYGKGVSVGSTAILQYVQHLITTPISFELSFSKVPGDFSEKSCKSSNSNKYVKSVAVVEKGFKHFLPKECEVDANEAQHYYINIRLVHFDKNKQEVVKSQCKNGSGCKLS